MKTFASILLASAFTAISALSDSELCLPTCTGAGAAKECTFVFKMDIYAGETGYYRVEGCDGVMPTLGMEEGVKHIFDQLDSTNWFHPLGFAYGPDGVYADETELELSVPAPGGNDQSCDGTNTCQSPIYFKDGVRLFSGATQEPDDFGLDEYEGVYFSGGRGDWLEGNFTVEVEITDAATTELFYFCHIHNFMSGRIKVLNTGTTVQKNAVDVAKIPYEYNVVSEEDAKCGTYNTSQYKDREGCSGMTFVCGDSISEFGQCMEQIDCAMHVEMRTGASNDPTTVFMHQMIAHHKNAVNMAKILLKANPPSIRCGTAYAGRRMLNEGGIGDPSGCYGNADNKDDGEFPVIELLWDIINTQNAQITLMRSWLDDNSQPAFDYCEHDDSTGLIIGLSVGAVVLVVGMALGGAWLYVKKNDASGSKNLA